MKKKNNKKQVNKQLIAKNSLFLMLSALVIIMLAVVFVFEFKLPKSASDNIIKDNLVKMGDGLYADTLSTGLDNTEPFSSKYYFKGKNVNNYMVFANKCWQIINIAQNGSIKIIYAGSSSNNQCLNVNNDLSISKDELSWGSNNSWNNSDVKTVLEKWVQNNNINNQLNIDFNSEKSKVENAIWYVGGVRFISQSLSADIKQERDNPVNSSNNSLVYEGKLGMISASDYLKISCETGAYNSTESCKDNNFLNKGEDYWTITATAANNKNSWAIRADGQTDAVEVKTTGYNIYPVLYLKSSIEITGNGSANYPYIVED